MGFVVSGRAGTVWLCLAEAAVNLLCALPPSPPGPLCACGRVLFVMFFGMVFFGLLHGLVMLPPALVLANRLADAIENFVAGRV